MKKDFLKVEKDVVYVNSPMIKIYIPKSYFTKTLAKYVGDKVNTFGVFKFKTFISNSDKSKGQIHTFKYPSMINVEYITKEEELVDVGEGGKMPYIVLTLEKGMVFLESVNHIQNHENVEAFLNHLNYSRTTNIGYSELMDMFHKVNDMNGVHLGVPSVLLELMIAELCRNPNNLSEAFRFAINKDKKMTDLSYKMVGIKNLPHFNSTFTSLAFEDLSKGILMSVKRTKTKENEEYSPIEKAIYY